MWIVTRYDDVRSVLKAPNLFSSKDSIRSIAPLCSEALAVLRTGVPPVPFIINSDPPAHSRWRRVINRAFSGARMQALEPQLRTITQSLLDALAPQGRAEVISALAFPLPLQVIARLCDVDDRHIEHLKRWGQDFLALMSSIMSPERQVAVAQSVVEYQHFLREHIARKREHPGEDITSALIAGGGDAPFSEPELVHQMMGLVFAGHETTTHLIGNALYHLLREPTRWAELVVHPAAIPAAIEEVLRIEPPIPTFIRTATANTALGGVRIAARENVLVVFGSANHDEHHFPEPERFDLHRHSESAHMGFGWGTHFSTAPSSPAWRDASCWRGSRRAGRPCGLLPASGSIGSRRSCSVVWRGLRSSGPSTPWPASPALGYRVSGWGGGRGASRCMAQHGFAAKRHRVTRPDRIQTRKE